MMIEEQIDVVADEYTFIAGVYSVLTSVGMTMNPSITQLNTLFVKDAEHKVEFTATYRGLTFRFRRAANNNTSTRLYKISVDGSKITETSLIYQNDTKDIDTVISRQSYFRIITNANILYIRTAENPSSTNYCMLFFFDKAVNNEDYVLYKKENTTSASLLTNSNFYILGDETNQIYKPARLLQYTVPNNGIDTLNSLVFCGTTTEENAVKSLSMTLNGVKSCSLVPANSVLTINNERYYSVATDCIVKIDEE